MRAPAGQLAFDFPAAVRPAAVRAPARVQPFRDVGWTAERSASYQPGHPWAHPDAYPDLPELRAKAAARSAASLAKPEGPDNRHLPYGFPAGTTPKARARRAEWVARVLARLADDEAGYLAVRSAARAEPNGKCCTYSVNREGLAYKHNHVHYGAMVLATVRALHPDALPR